LEKEKLLESWQNRVQEKVGKDFITKTGRRSEKPGMVQKALSHLRGGRGKLLNGHLGKSSATNLWGKEAKIRTLKGSSL